MGLKFSNFGKAVVGSAPSGTTGLSFTVAAGTGLLYPSLGAGDYFYGIFKDASGNREIVKVEARSTDAMTIAPGGRGLDGTTARTWAAGDYFVAGICNVALQESLGSTNLQAIALLVSAADQLPYFTGSGTASLTGLSAFIRTLLDDADASTARTTLGAASKAVDETISANKTYSGISTFTGIVDVSGTVLKGATPLAFDGATAGTNKTSLSIVDPTANRTITIPDANVDLTNVRGATTSLAGVTPYATGAQVIAGISANAAVTPASLTSAMNIATKGHYTHPGGLIEQWGTITGNTDVPAGGITVSATFDIPFNTVIGAAGNIITFDASTTRNIMQNLTSLTTTGLVFYVFEGTGAVQASWSIYYRAWGI